MPSVTGLVGSNPGPVVNSNPDLTQLPIGDVNRIFALQFTLTPAAVAANTSAEQTFLSSGSGLKLGDFVYVNKPTAQAGLGIVGARVSADDTLAITFGNFTGAPITPTAGENYKLLVVRPMTFANLAAITV